MDETSLAELRAFLEREAGRLREEIADFERASRESMSEASGENNYRDHMGDQGSATFERELDLSLEGGVRVHLAQVERALERIVGGTYGRCVRCRDEIPGSRLEAVPDAELCVPCKEQEESR